MKTSFLSILTSRLFSKHKPWTPCDFYWKRFVLFSIFYTLLWFLLLHVCSWCSHHLDSFSPSMKAHFSLSSMGQWVETDTGFVHDAIPIKCLSMPNFDRSLTSLSLSLSLSLSCFHPHTFFFLPWGFRILRCKEVKQCYLSIVAEITQMVKPRVWAGLEFYPVSTWISKPWTS